MRAPMGWTRTLLTPAPMAARPRWIHWLAWAAAVASLAALAYALTRRAADVPLWLAQADLWLSVALAVEFFTRPGLRQEKLRYVGWRWFDFLAMAPVVFLAAWVPLHAMVVWAVVLARVARVIDRTFGDGFVKRHVLALVGAIEEEISDRVLGKILGRVEGELKRARFGEAASEALARRKKAFLDRIYEEQKPEGAAASRILGMTGLQSAVERFEERIFDAVVKVVGSRETDQLIVELIGASLGEAREELERRSWRSEIGLRDAGAAKA